MQNVVKTNTMRLDSLSFIPAPLRETIFCFSPAETQRKENFSRPWARRPRRKNPDLSGLFRHISSSVLRVLWVLCERLLPIPFAPPYLIVINLVEKPEFVVQVLHDDG